MTSFSTLIVINFYLSDIRSDYSLALSDPLKMLLVQITQIRLQPLVQLCGKALLLRYSKLSTSGVNDYVALSCVRFKGKDKNLTEFTSFYFVWDSFGCCTALLSSEEKEIGGATCVSLKSRCFHQLIRKLGNYGVVFVRKLGYVLLLVCS